MEFHNIVKLSQNKLKRTVTATLEDMGYPVTSVHGFVYAEGTVPVLLVAHLDTVFDKPVRTILCSKDKRYLTSPEGIGGDGRCGVYIISQIIEQYRCHILFCEDEECGGLGAKAFTESGIKPDVNYIIELDRRGENDAVFYRCCNQEFQQFVTGYGFNEEHGTFSDISIIAPHLGIAAVNLSAGYYRQHTTAEFVDTLAMQNICERVCTMVAAQTERFEYMEHSFSFGGYGENLSIWDDNDNFVQLMPLPSSSYVNLGGMKIDSSGYMIDKSGRVYRRLKHSPQFAVRAIGSKAQRADGAPPQFSPLHARYIEILDMCDVDKVV